MHEISPQDVVALDENAPRCMEPHRVDLHQRRGLHQFPRLAIEAVLTPSSPLLVWVRSPYRGYPPRISVSAVRPTPISVASYSPGRYRSSFILTLRLGSTTAASTAACVSSSRCLRAANSGSVSQWWAP